jgi:hypothetical protein
VASQFSNLSKSGSCSNATMPRNLNPCVAEKELKNSLMALSETAVGVDGHFIQASLHGICF